MFNYKTHRIVFQPKDRERFGGKRRFGVGAKRLAAYIGKSNFEAAVKKASEANTDKVRMKFRVQGIVDIYFI